MLQTYVVNFIFHKVQNIELKCLALHDSDIGLIKVELDFSFSIPGLFQTWNSDKPGF